MQPATANLLVMTNHFHVAIHALVAITSLGASGCGAHVQGSGHLVEVREQTAAFSGVEIGDNLHARVSVGEQAVVLDVDDNIVDLVQVSVEGGTLVIHRCPGCDDFKSSAQSLIHISSPVIGFLAVSGSASMIGEANGATLGFDASGDGVLVAHATAAGTVSVEASGESSVALSGMASELTVSSSGEAAVRSTCPTTVLRVDASGSSRVAAGASQSARVEASGDSVISVTGSPGDRHVESSGEASVVFSGSP